MKSRMFVVGLFAIAMVCSAVSLFADETGTEAPKSQSRTIAIQVADGERIVMENDNGSTVSAQSITIGGEGVQPKITLQAKPRLIAKPADKQAAESDKPGSAGRTNRVLQPLRVQAKEQADDERKPRAVISAWRLIDEENVERQVQHLPNGVIVERSVIVRDGMSKAMAEIESALKDAGLEDDQVKETLGRIRKAIGEAHATGQVRAFGHVIPELQPTDKPPVPMQVWRPDVRQTPPRYMVGVRCVSTPEGLTVFHVVPHMPAAKAGLRNGDLLLSAGDHVLEQPGDLVAIVQKAGETDKPFKVKLLRDGEEQIVELKPVETPRAVVGVPGVRILEPERPEEFERLRGDTLRGLNEAVRDFIDRDGVRPSRPMNEMPDAPAIERMQKQIRKLTEQVEELSRKVEGQ